MTNFLKWLFLSMIVVMLTACGGGGGSDTPVNGGSDTPVNGGSESPVNDGGTGSPVAPAKGKISPNIVEVVSLTSIETDKIIFEWIEVTDDTTHIDNMLYEIHISKANKDFIPNLSTFIKKVKGTNNTKIDGLEANTLYYCKIVAIDEDNMKSISFVKSIKTSAIKVEVSSDAKYLNSINTIAKNSIDVDSNITIKNNAIIVSEANGGFARRVINIVDKNTTKILETKSVSLAEIYNNVSVHTSVKLIDLTQSAKVNTLRKNYKAIGNNSYELSKKWDSGLTLYDIKVNNKNLSISSKSTQVENNIVSEESFSVIMPKYYAFDIDDTNTEKIKLYFTPKEEKELFDDNFYYEVCGVRSQIITSNESRLYFAKIEKSRDNLFNLDFTHEFQAIKKLVNDKPYTIEFYVDTAKQGTCNDAKPIYEETYTIKRDLYIGTGSITISGKINETIPFSGYAGKNLNITNTLTGSYSPELIIDSFVKDGKLETGKVEVISKINIAHEIRAALEESKGFEYKKIFINKKFIKVIPAGAIPLIFNGSFEVALVIEGNATGKIDITNTLINKYEFHAGFQYNKDTEKWNYIGKSENSFEVELKGEAGATVILKVSLQPKLTLKLYDSVGGGVALDPYVKAETSGRIVKSISENIDISTMTGIHTQFINDQFITVDKVDGSLGLDLRWYVIASIFDYRLASYPENVEEDKASTYAQVQIAKPKMIASLPKLSIKNEIYLNKIGEDSRLMIIEGKAKPVVNVFYNTFNRGSKYIINHRKWSFTELIRPRQEMLTMIDDNKSLLLVDEVGSDYQIRMLEESTLGLPHVVESTFNSEDENYNNLPDGWEKAYNIYELGNTENSENKDSDGDKLTNIEEYQYGTHPDKIDSDLDGCTDKEEIDINSDPLNKNDRPARCLSDGSETPTVAIPLGKTIPHNQDYILIPTVLDDDMNTISYKWSIKWSDIGEGKNSSIDGLSLTLTPPILQENSSGYVDINLTVIDKDGNSATSNTERYSYSRDADTSDVTIDLGSDISIQEETSKNFRITKNGDIDLIDTITCFTTPSIAGISNDDTWISLTIPKYDTVINNAFTIRCTAKDEEGNILAKDSKQITITKKPIEEPTNQAPTITLPPVTLTQGVSKEINPTVSDDDGVENLTYRWSAVWSGDNHANGSTSSLIGASLTLHVPDLEAGESGSVMVSLTVADQEGLSATYTRSYAYSLEHVEAIEFVGDNFTDGTTLPRGSSKTLTWQIKNVSSADLVDVQLNETVRADALTVTDIEPSTIDIWSMGETKTFTATVTVPNDVIEGTHRHQWNFYHDTSEALPYSGYATSAAIYFEFKTTNPNDLIGRLITDKKLVSPDETITSLLEITSGNAPYKVEVNWGDGRDDTFDNVAKNTAEGMTKSLTHSYSSEGSYNITVKVTDNAGKQATLTDSIKVETSPITTEWTADVHDIETDERATNVDIVVEDVVSGGVTYGKYHTDWSPTLKADSTEYFVKYRLPIPSKLLMLDKKMRVTVQGVPSDIEAYDREINFKTSNSKEYTASIRHKDFEDTLADGTAIRGGYFTTKDLSTGAITKEEAEFLNSEYVELDGVYAMATTPSSSLNVYSYSNDTYTNLFSKNISLSGNWLTELDVTFKGNGLIKLVLLEYDQDDDGEFGSSEKLVLSTADKSVDWSGFATLSTSLLANAGVDQIITYQEDAYLSASNSVGLIVSYQWYENNVLLGTEENLSLATLEEGTHNITLVVKDSNDVSSTDEVTVLVDVSYENSNCNSEFIILNRDEVENIEKSSSFSDFSAMINTEEKVDFKLLDMADSNYFQSDYFDSNNSNFFYVGYSRDVEMPEYFNFSDGNNNNIYDINIQLTNPTTKECMIVPLKFQLIKYQIKPDFVLTISKDINTSVDMEYSGGGRIFYIKENITINFSGGAGGLLFYLEEGAILNFNSGGGSHVFFVSKNATLSNEDKRSDKVYYENSAIINGFHNTVEVSSLEIITDLELPPSTGSTKVKKTGQTKSYNTDGDEVTDDSVKDDGYYQSGVTPNYSRSGDVVTDHITGLEWQDNEEVTTVIKLWNTYDNYNDGKYSDTSGDTATTYCSSLVLDGGGWRLPTIVELEGIVVDGEYNPSIDTRVFENYNISDYYWSSTTPANCTFTAWIVHLYDGSTSNNSKNNLNSVRCVRSGQ